MASVGADERFIRGFGGEPEEKRRLGRPKRADGRIILNFIFKKCDRRVGEMAWEKYRD